jgi:hypothetical protein
MVQQSASMPAQLMPVIPPQVTAVPDLSPVAVALSPAAIGAAWPTTVIRSRRPRASTRTKSPQTNGIRERFHKTLPDEFYPAAFRKKVYRAIEELRADLDERMRHYNEARTHQGRWRFGKTPMQTFLDSKPLAREKQQISEAA